MPRLQQSPLGLVWKWSLQKLLLETWSSFAASGLTPGTVEASAETLQFPCISSKKICLTTYIPFSVKSRLPCWSLKTILWELDSFLMWTHSFVPINLQSCRPREWNAIFSKLSEYIIDSITHGSAMQPTKQTCKSAWNFQNLSERLAWWVQLHENLHSGWPNPGIAIPGRVVRLSCRH